MFFSEELPLSPLSINNEEDLNPPISQNPNKRIRKNSDRVLKKIKTLEKTDKYKSWVWTWFNPVLLDNGKTGAECLVKITDEKICGRLYSNGNSTGNLIVHLSGNHQITEELKIEEKSVNIIYNKIYKFIN
jgi:hypothetical protein